MKRQWLALSRQYQAALEIHLRQGPKSTMQPAHRLGRQAVALGLETAELTGIHRAALTALLLPSSPVKKRKRTLQQAATFLFEAMGSWQTAGSGAKTATPADRESASLRRRATQLVAANRRLKQGVVDRKTAGDALKKTSRHYAKLLRESEQLKKHLRHLTHRLLSAQEAERKKISHELQDGVAQTLLGINVRLLTLKKTARGNPTMLRKEIASTQKVVEQSVRTINRFAREFDNHRPA